MEEKVLSKRHLGVTVAIGVICLILNEPFMASCSAGLPAGVISILYLCVSSIQSGTILFALPVIAGVLLAGFVYGKFINNLQDKKWIVIWASLLYMAGKALTIASQFFGEWYTCPPDQLEKFFNYLRDTAGNRVYELCFSTVFFALFIAIKVYIIDKKLEEE